MKVRFRIVLSLYAHSHTQNEYWSWSFSLKANVKFDFKLFAKNFGETEMATLFTFRSIGKVNHHIETSVSTFCFVSFSVPDYFLNYVHFFTRNLDIRHFRSKLWHIHSFNKFIWHIKGLPKTNCAYWPQSISSATASKVLLKNIMQSTVKPKKLRNTKSFI